MNSSANETRGVKSVRIGIVGCGRLTRNKHLKAIQTVEDLECAAVADLDSTARNSVADQYGIESRYEDLDALLGHPEIDAVALIVPTRVKADLVIQALAAGKRVLVEKPLADSLEAADRVAAAAPAPEWGMTSFNIVFHRAVQDALHQVREGEIGEIESIRTQWSSPWLNTAEHGDIPHKEMKRRHGEGAFTDLGSQCFDLWRRFAGAEVEMLWAQCIHEQREEQAGTVSARMTNGILATGTFSTRTSHQIEIEICGDKGRLRVDSLRFDGLDILPLSMIPGSGWHRIASLKTAARELRTGLRETSQGGSYQASVASMWAHFADLVRGRTAPICTLQDGYAALAITRAAQESARTGSPVQPNTTRPRSIERAS